MSQLHRTTTTLLLALLCAAPASTQKATLLSRLEARGRCSASSSTTSFTPDGSALFFGADTLSDGIPDLFSVAADLDSEPKLVSPHLAGAHGFSRDGRWLAYVSDGLYVRGVSAHGPGRRLADRAATGSTPFAFTPDSTRLVFVDEGVRSARLDDGSPPLLLAPSSPAFLHVTPDSTRVVYYADGYRSVPLDGSAAPLQLTGPIAQLGSEVELTPDSRLLLYSEVRSTHLSMVTEWFAVPVAGGTPVQLTVPLDPARQVIGYRALVPGLARLVYKVMDYQMFPQGPAFTGAHLYSAPLDGGPGILLDSNPSTPSSVPSPVVGAGGWLVYLALPAGSNLRELFRRPADGSGGPKLVNAPRGPGGVVSDFALTPDGTRVVYVADQDVLGRREVFVVPLDGSAAPLRLNAPNPSTRVLQVAPLVAPDGRWVVYAVDQFSTKALHSAPLDGSAPARELVSVAGNGLSYGDAVITRDGRRVVFQADRSADPGFELYGVPIDGSAAPARLSAPLAAGNYIEEVHHSPRGERLAYLTLENNDRNLYLAPVDGSAPAVRLNPTEPGPIAGDVTDFGASGEWVVHRADAREDGVVELFATPIDGDRPPYRLSGTMASGGDVQEWVFSPDDTRVVYRADQSADGCNELFVRRLGLRFPTQRLHPAFSANRSVESFALDALGSAAVYRADQDVNGRVELYRAPLDGSGTSARLNAPLVSGGNVQGFALDPLGVHVVYRAGQATADVIELYGRPLDRSTPAVRLNPALVAGGDVLDQAVDATGRRAVYRADQSVDEVIELHSVALDASSPAQRISAPLVTGGDVLDYVLDPTGRCAVYRADQIRDEVRELFAVPLDGSSAPLKLNPALLQHGDVRAQYTIDAAGQRACFVVDPTGLGNGNYLLFSAPLDGSTAAVRLSPPAAGSFGGTFVFHDASVFFLTQVAGPTAELWRAPKDGSAAAVRVTPAGDSVRGSIDFSDDAVFYATLEGVHRVALAGGLPQLVTPRSPRGLVSSFRVTPGFVVYRADHALSAVIDLWSSALGPLAHALDVRR